MSHPVFDNLISVAQLQDLQHRHVPTMIFDCSFDLTQPSAGLAMYGDKHIHGAVYVDVNTVLSEKDKSKSMSGGRHPLPTAEKFAQWLNQVGFTNDMQAVVYDRQGLNYCGRMWWMLQWIGHSKAAVLDGGFQAWQTAGGAVEAGHETGNKTGQGPATLPFKTGPSLMVLTDAHQVLTQLTTVALTVLDARAGPRYRGEIEPLDPVAGRIPGALNRPFSTNLTADGFLKPAATLKAEFEALLGERSAASVVHQCGSGVSAVPNLLAMRVAGLGTTALYAGSWSDWCSDPTRPVEKG